MEIEALSSQKTPGLLPLFSFPLTLLIVCNFPRARSSSSLSPLPPESATPHREAPRRESPRP